MSIKRPRSLSKKQFLISFRQEKELISICRVILKESAELCQNISSRIRTLNLNTAHHADKEGCGCYFFLLILPIIVRQIIHGIQQQARHCGPVAQSEETMIVAEQSVHLHHVGAAIDLALLVFKPAGKALGRAGFFIQFDIGKMVQITETGNAVRDIGPCDHFGTGTEDRIKVVEILIYIGSGLCKG